MSRLSIKQRERKLEELWHKKDYRLALKHAKFLCGYYEDQFTDYSKAVQNCERHIYNNNNKNKEVKNGN